MHRGFTKTDNLGDVTAKAGAQGTAAGLVGTGMGIGLSWILNLSGGPIDPSLMFGIFVPLSGMHLGAAFLANRAVVTRTLNVERTELALAPWIKALGESADSKTIPKHTLNTLIQTPDQVSRTESILRGPRLFRIPLVLEPRLSDIFSHRDPLTPELVHFLTVGLAGLESTHYRIYISSNRVCLWFLHTAQDADLLNGFFHACVIRHLLSQGYSVNDAYAKSLEIIAKVNVSESMAQQGWEIQNSHLGDQNARLQILESYLNKSAFTKNK